MAELGSAAGDNMFVRNANMGEIGRGQMQNQGIATGFLNQQVRTATNNAHRYFVVMSGRDQLLQLIDGRWFREIPGWAADLQPCVWG